MTTKTLNLNIELCDSGAILSYTDDGCHRNNATTINEVIECLND